MTHAARILVAWKFRHAVVAFIGVALNLLLSLVVFCWPGWALEQLSLPQVTTLWLRGGVGFWLILTLFYIPMIVDIDRFRILAWLSVLPARSFGAVFFLLAVVAHGAPDGLLIVGLLEAGIAIAALHCLIRISRIEQAIATGEPV